MRVRQGKGGLQLEAGTLDGCERLGVGKKNRIAQDSVSSITGFW